MPWRATGRIAAAIFPRSWPSGPVSREASAAHGGDPASRRISSRAGRHPQVGRLSIADLLAEWVHHDRNHQRQILANIQAYVWPHMGNAQRFSRPEP
mgnify:CR=1 FL=1